MKIVFENNTKIEGRKGWEMYVEDIKDEKFSEIITLLAHLENYRDMFIDITLIPMVKEATGLKEDADARELIRRMMKEIQNNGYEAFTTEEFDKDFLYKREWKRK